MLVCQLLSSLRRKCCSLFCLVLSKLQLMLLLEKNSWLQRDLSACFHASLSLSSSSSSHRPLFAFSFPSEGVTAQRLAPHRSDWWLADEGGVVSVSVSRVESTSSAQRASPPSVAICIQSAVEPRTGSDSSASAAQQHPGDFLGRFFFLRRQHLSYPATTSA